MPLQQIKNLLDAHAQPILSGDAFDARNPLSASMVDLRMGVEESHWRAAREILDGMVTSPGADAVQWRLAHLAGRIDSLQRSNRTVRCLSLACGHLHEAELSEAVRQRDATIFAVDRDSRTLREVSKRCSQFDVDPICASVHDVLNGDVRFGHLDLAYAAGLYDFLSTPVATALTAKLFSMLDTGGIVIVPNFLDRNPVRRCMESITDGKLLVRSREEIIELAASVPKHEIASQRYYEDPYAVVAYLELKKAC